MGNEKITLEFDGSQPKKGYQDVAQAAKQAATENASLGKTSAKTSEQIHKEGDEAAKTAKYLENLGKSYSVTTADIDKSAKQASASINRATTNLHAFGTGVGPLQAVGQAAQRTAEGLGKLGGTAAYLGDKDMVAATQGLNAFAGGLAATATPLGSLMAIIASGIVVMKELNKTTIEGASNANIFDKAVIDLLDTFYQGKNTVSGMVDEINRLNAEGDKFVANFASGVDDMSKRIRKSFEDIKAISLDYANNRQDYELRVKVSGIEDVKILEEQSKAAIQRLEEMAKRVPEDFDQRERFQQELEAETQRVRRETAIYEARRQQILDEQRQAAIRAAEEEKKAKEEAAKKAIEDHKNEMARIKAEKEARIKAANDRREAERKADEEKRNRLEEFLRKSKEPAAPTTSPGNQSAPPAQGMTDQPNPYGEGEAPTAGNDSSAAFADAINPLGQFTTDFNIGGNSYIEGDGTSPAVGTDPFQELVDRIDKRLTDANIARTAKETEMERLRKENDEKRMQTLEDRFGTRDKKYIQDPAEKREFQKYDNALKDAYRDDEREASRNFDKNGPTDAQKEDAVKKISDKTTELFQKQTGADEAKQELEETTTQGMVQMAARISAMESFLKKQNEMRARALGLGRGTAPSNRASQARANP